MSRPLQPEEAGARIAMVLFGGIAVLVALSLPVGCMGALWLGLVADSTLYIHHDGRGPVTVVLDGQEVATLDDAGVTWLELPRGDHELVLRGRDGAQTFELDGVSGLDEWMVRTNPNTCFAVVDVTRVMYGTDDPCDHLDRARITCFHRDFPKRELGSHPAFRVDDLPAQSGRMETLWLDFPCNGPSAKPTAQELLAEELGCR